MLKANAHLSLEVDEDMKNAISTNPLVEPVLMDANTLVQSASQVHSEDAEEFKQHVAEAFGPLAPIVNFLSNNLGDDVTLSVSGTRVGLKARVNADGLATLVKTIAKFKTL